MKSSYNLDLALWGLGFAIALCAYGFFVRRFRKRWVRLTLTFLPIVGMAAFIALALNDAHLDEIRTEVTHIEMYNAAVNTFRTRYNGLPGDHASIMKYFPKETYPEIQNGNGNRLIEGEESVQFWQQLEAVQLIPVQESSGGVREMPYERELSYFEKRNAGAEFYEPLGVVVYSSGGRNWYQIARYRTEGEFKILPSFTPEEAYNWDAKLDDGKPFTGAVTIRSAAHDGSSRLDGDITEKEVGFEAGNAYACINESDISSEAAKRAATYAIANENLACSIRIRMN